MNKAYYTLNIPREYLSEIARRGGKVTGACKRRGDSSHYRALVAKRKDRQK